MDNEKLYDLQARFEEIPPTVGLNADPIIEDPAEENICLSCE